MAEYIDREAVMKIAKDGNHSDFGRSMADLTSLREVLEDTPTADVAEVRHGTWIANRSPVEVEFSCSECGFSYIEADSYQECDYNFCPNCGARMDGDTE